MNPKRSTTSLSLTLLSLPLTSSTLSIQYIQIQSSYYSYYALSMFLLLSSIYSFSFFVDWRLIRKLLLIGFCLSNFTLEPWLTLTMVLCKMHLLAAFDLHFCFFFSWPIWRVLLQDNSMAFMVPELHSFLRIRMGCGKRLILDFKMLNLLFYYLLKNPNSFMLFFTFSFWRFFIITTVIWQVLIVPLPYWKLLVMICLVLILNQCWLRWGTFNSLMEGKLLKFGLEPCPLWLCNGHISQIHCCFSISWYIVPDIYVKFMPLMDDMLNWIWNYFLFVNFLICVDSFMPIHTGGETDLRFVYCAGKRKRHEMEVLLGWLINNPGILF